MIINVFIENIFGNFELDEVQIYNDVNKMADFIFHNNDLIKSSCLADYKFNTISFDIVFCSNDEIRKINKDYRNKDCATDVITFAIFADSPENEKFIIDDEISLGEIIVSVDKIRQQAQDNNIPFKDELYYIISHGILHLLGYDHQTESDYNFMVENQNKAKAVVL